MFIYGGTPLRPIHAVLFDMDGLLIDSERLAIECDSLTFQDMGIHLPRSVFLKTLGETITASNQIYASHLNVPFDPDWFWKQTAEHYASMVSQGQLKAKPGAVQLLDFLDAGSISHALASSSGHERISLSLRACGLENRFQIIACGDDPVRSKPEPDIFLLAAERLHVPPEDCLVLEDSLSGIRAGFRGGMQVCFIPDLLEWNPQWSSFCHHACESLLDVMTFFKG